MAWQYEFNCADCHRGSKGIWPEKPESETIPCPNCGKPVTVIATERKDIE